MVEKITQQIIYFSEGGFRRTCNIILRVNYLSSCFGEGPVRFVVCLVFDDCHVRR